MIKKNKIVAIFAIFILGLLSVIVIFSNLWGLNINAKNYKLYVYMDNSSNLSLGTPVLMNGVKVGKVQDIYLESDSVVVILSIDRRVKVPLGSEVRISYKGLIGDLLVNIFRSTNKEFHEDGDRVKGEGPISPNSVLEKMTKIAAQLEIITEDISKAGVGKLIKNIEKFSSNINETYVDIEKVLQDFKKDNYKKINGTISNIEKSTEKVSDILNSTFSFYPELEFVTTEFDREKTELDGAVAVQLGRIYAKKRGFKNWKQGYTLKWLKDFGPLMLSAGILENSPGASLEVIPFQYFNLGMDAYNFNNFSDFSAWKLDFFGRVIFEDIRFKIKYGMTTKQLSMGLGYKF